MFSLQVWLLLSMMIILNQAVIINPKRLPSKDIDSRYSSDIIYPDAKKNISKDIDSRYSNYIINPDAKRNIIKGDDSRYSLNIINPKVGINITCSRSPSSKKKICSKDKDANKRPHKQTRILVQICGHGHKYKHKHTHKHKHKHTHKHKNKHTHRHKHKNHIEPQGHIKSQGNKQLQGQKQSQGPTRSEWQSQYMETTAHFLVMEKLYKTFWKKS
ncbi:uncharacterized protein LOC100570410 [Acyrthosiphon pisum]|uniref:Uncharacterized protein n=1 Tax=Acyrthosiphon pisum TaxID=7029 RepID=A0A8R1W6T1_ACYPI|nr:uncharacterized protein LOC100570410 [Acyrthosiphon pisum]|eukprot:XP_003247620.1 PREDICTED: uncharacterized protein LOC100570410 [Acyrthosiphon pisum]